MQYFHCLPDSTRFLELPQVQGTLDILASAYRIKRYPSIKKWIGGASSLFLDSGMISAWKAERPEWKDMQDFVINLANELDVDYCAHLDLPMEPEMLGLNGWSPEHALEQTILNALRFRDAVLPDHCKRVFVVQGYQLREYERCLDLYESLGIMEATDMLAIGSVCMRSPKKGLYRVCKLVRKRCPNHRLHAFGVGRKAWVDELVQIGIDSFDSADASLQVAYNRGHLRVGGHRDMRWRDIQFMTEYAIKDFVMHNPSTTLQLKLWS